MAWRANVHPMSSDKPLPQPGGVRRPERPIVEASPAPRQVLPLRATGPGAEDVTLASRLWVLYEGRWTIAAIAAAVVAAAGAYLLVATPIYRSTVTLQVEDRTRSLAGLEELSNLFAERVPAETEIEIILSRTLLGGVVDELGLDLRVEPRRFPLLGQLQAARYQGGHAGSALPRALQLRLGRRAHPGRPPRRQRRPAGRDR